MALSWQIMKWICYNVYFKKILKMIEFVHYPKQDKHEFNQDTFLIMLLSNSLFLKIIRKWVFIRSMDYSKIWSMQSWSFLRGTELPFWRIPWWHQKIKPPIHQFTNLKSCKKAREPFKIPYSLSTLKNILGIVFSNQRLERL